MALRRWAFVAVVVAAVLAEDAPKTMPIQVPEPGIPAIATPVPKGNRSNNATFAGSPFWSKNKTGLSPFRLPNITMPKPRLAPTPELVERGRPGRSMTPPAPPKAASGPGVGRPHMRPVAHAAAEVSMPRQPAPGPPKGFLPQLPDCKKFDGCVSGGTDVDKCCSTELGSNERACGLCAKAACVLRSDFCAGSRSNGYCSLCFQIADRELLIRPAPSAGGLGAQVGAPFGAKLPPLTLPTFGQKGKPGRGAMPGAKGPWGGLAPTGKQVPPKPNQAWPKPKVQPPRNAHSGMSSFKHEM
mmetsp:Transcript_95809/g.257530  ORF Transcript_95809/g.257530 Transcript_95809/m.257530 type:complete len:299 (-) Transcript_95809:95-991(-)